MSQEPVNTVLVGLIERGCTPAEALDYYMVELGPHTQTSWAAIRGINQSSVSENISKAREKLA